MIRSSLLIAAFTLWAGQALAADPAPGDAKAGLRLFMADGCYQCHGVQGQGGGKSGPRLAPGALPREAIVQQLRAPRGRMPPYTAVVLSEAQVDDIVAYLHSIPQGRPASAIALLNQP